MGLRITNNALVRTAIAHCYLRSASATEGHPERIARLKQARKWNHRIEGLSAMTRPLAAALDAEGDRHAADRNWEDAYTAWSDALALDPRLSWTRRKAERARDRRLDITPPSGVRNSSAARLVRKLRQSLGWRSRSGADTGDSG